MKRQHDLIVSLGGDRSVESALRLVGLEYQALPFDRLEGLTALERIELIDRNLSEDRARELAVRGQVDPETLLRRLARLYRLVRRSRRVLLVWVDVPNGLADSDDVLRSTLEAFRARWPGVEFALEAFRLRPGARLGDYEVSESDGLRTVAFDYRTKAPDAEGADPRLLGGWLRKEHAMADYRTPDEKTAWERRCRERKERRLAEMGFGSRMVTRIERKVFDVLKAHLLRLGVIAE